MLILKKCLVYFILIVLIACNGNPNAEKKEVIAKYNSENHQEISHAQGFQISKEKGITRLTVLNPWQGARNVIYEYYLLERGSTPPSGIHPQQIIYIPVQKIVCLSTTHIGFIDLIGETDKISGIAGSRYVSNVKLLEKIKKGLVKDVGYDQNLNYELLVQLNPDVVMVYGVGSESASYVNKLRDLGIKVIFNAEYLEETPLAKAEWLKFIACLFQKEVLAQKLFSEIEAEYNSLRQLTAKIKTRPKVLINLPWKGTWFMAGGKSFFAKMIDDAGGEYLWKENKGKENFPVDMENVFQRAADADIWIKTGTANSINEIVAEDSRLKLIKPLVEKKVYNNNNRLSLAGGNDYWESGIVKPQVILRDLIYILHPDLLPNHQMVFYKKLD